MEPPDPPCDPSGDFETWVIQTRLAQGLPTRVEDLAVLARVADLISLSAVAENLGAEEGKSC